jgi:hypothetical protein
MRTEVADPGRTIRAIADRLLAGLMLDGNHRQCGPRGVRKPWTRAPAHGPDQAAVLVFKGVMVQIMLPKKAVPGERDVTESGSQAEAPTSHRFAA